MIYNCTICNKEGVTKTGRRMYCDSCKLEKTREWSRKSHRQRPLWPKPDETHSGLCEICGDKRPLKADHDHLIRAELRCCYGAPCEKCFRGFLCQSCNIGLGQFLDCPVRLGAAVEYIEKHRKVNP